jgi:uncharacterized membrane protein
VTRERSVYSGYRDWVNAGTDTERTAFFSDAVFAIAMTLLAVEIQVPTVPDTDLAHALREQVPEYLAFALSFAVVGAAWMSHHRMFRLLDRYDATLQRLNLLALLFVALVSYGTGVLAAYAEQSVAVILYAAIVAGMGLAHLVMWQYAWSRQLFVNRLDPALFGYLRARGVVVPAVFLASIPVALVSPDGAKYLWIAIAVLQFALIRVYRRRTVPELAPSPGGDTWSASIN